jgi:hypothetical protein
MRRLIALLLACLLTLSGCSSSKINNKSTVNKSTTEVGSSSSLEENLAIDDNNNVYALEFEDLSDPHLLRYVEDNIYSKLVANLDSDECYVENVAATYISKEYLEEFACNSQTNVYFGYNLKELEEQFQGTKYIFTLGDDGQTTVKEFEEYDDTYDKVLKNVAIGTGVILICATVSAATGGMAPAVSIVFAASAKTGTTFALSSGT